MNKIDDKFNIYKENTVVLLGVGDGAKLLYQLFKNNKLNINYFCDNNKDNWGKLIENIPIISTPQLQQLVQSKNSQNSGEGREIVVQIAVPNIDNSINQQLNSIGIRQIISFNDALKIFNYTPPQEKISPEQAEFNVIKKRYTDSLRGLNNDKFPLLKPKDMPEHAKELVKKLEYLKQAYLAGENFYIDKEKTMLLQDFCSHGYMNGVRRIGGYQGHLIEREVGLNVRFPEKIDIHVENVSLFDDYLKKRNIPFMYMQIPCKISPNSYNLPEGTINISNIKANQFVDGLINNGVSVFDYRKYMIENNIDFLESFYKTDMHWKNTTIFDASKELCKKIDKLIEISIDWKKLDISNYYKITYPNIFCSVAGKQAGILYSGIDDLDLILPKYDTSYTWECVEKGLQKKGTAKEALLYPLQLDWKYYVTTPYAVYSLTHDGYNVIKNHNSKNDKKILLLNDSFSNPLASFIAPQFSELHFLDLRGNKKDLFGIIEKVKPDIVVMLYTTFTIFHFKLHELMGDKNL